MAYQVEKEQVKYNLGSEQLSIVGFLLRRASISYTRHNYSDWFYALKGIKLRIISRLNTKERTALASIENIVMPGLYRLRPTDNEDSHENNQRILITVYPAIEKYETLMMELLEEKGFLTPLREDRTKLFGQIDTNESND